MKLTALEITVMEQAKEFAYTIKSESSCLQESLDLMELIILDYSKDSHYAVFVDFFVRCAWNLNLNEDSFLVAKLNPKPPNNGSPNTTTSGGSR